MALALVLSFVPVVVAGVLGAVGVREVLWVALAGLALVLYAIARHQHINWRFRRDFLTATKFDPTQIPAGNFKKIEQCLRFTEDATPKNVLFFSTYNPLTNVL